MKPELLEERRESWGSRGAFVLAAIGSAVGLGNLWAFPYKLYSYGGGAFLIPYIIAMFCIGIPMLILEFSLGHFTQRAAPDAYGRTNKKLEFVGWWGIVLAFVIITYYPVILAYCISFMCYSAEAIISGDKLPWAGEGIEGVENARKFFEVTYLNQNIDHTLGPIQSKLLIPLIISWVAMYFCIFRGVNLLSKIVWITVPLPWLMLAILTVKGLTLEGSMKGLTYYLHPVWSQLAKPSTWRFAFGQVFFSMSLAFGVMVTYASFLHRKSDLNNNAAIIGLADFATSFIAGLAIFATLGGMAHVTQQAGSPVPVEKVVAGGPGLVFIAFPYALAQLPGSAYWSFIFFFILVTLGIDSAFSITESVLAAIVDKTGWPRWLVLPIISLAGIFLGLLYITRGGLNWLGTIDGFINGTWGIAFVGLLECVVLGWVYRIDNLRLHANDRSDWKLGRWWNYAIRVFIPIALGTLFFWSLSDDLTSQGGFVRTSEGKWIIPNCVGITIVALAPVIAIVMSIIKNPLRLEEENLWSYARKPESYQGHIGGITAFIFAIASAAIMGVLFFEMCGLTLRMLWISSFSLALLAIVISNYVLEKYSRTEQPVSWFARWAGIIATLDVSAFFASALIHITKDSKATQAVHVASDHLSGVSYVILSFVFLIIIGGLGWCFSRALTAASKNAPTQHPDEVGT